MTANEVAARYSLAKLAEMFSAAAKELQEVDAMLNNECITETFRATTKAYKETLTQYAQIVLDAIKIKEKRN